MSEERGNSTLTCVAVILCLTWHDPPAASQLTFSSCSIGKPYTRFLCSVFHLAAYFFACLSNEDILSRLFFFSCCPVNTCCFLIPGRYAMPRYSLPRHGTWHYRQSGSWVVLTYDTSGGRGVSEVTSCLYRNLAEDAIIFALLCIHIIQILLADFDVACFFFR